MSDETQMDINTIAVLRRFRLIRIPCEGMGYPDRFKLIDNAEWWPPTIHRSVEEARRHIATKLWGTRMPADCKESATAASHFVPVETVIE